MSFRLTPIGILAVYLGWFVLIHHQLSTYYNIIIKIILINNILLNYFCKVLFFSYLEEKKIYKRKKSYLIDFIFIYPNIFNKIFF